MKIYSIFDDFGEVPTEILKKSGIDIVIHPLGLPRPNEIQMKAIFDEYDGVIIGTSQKMGKEMFENVSSPKIIATASVGLDHIQIPEGKKHFITVLNTPKANAQSVAEYTFGCALTCCKRLYEGTELYREAKNNKSLFQKPDDLSGKKLGVIGAGNISKRIMDYGVALGMEVVCWTAHPELHKDVEDNGVKFESIEELICSSDVISVNLPNKAETEGIISESRVDMMKDDAIFISISRKETVDIQALFEKAKEHAGFYVCLDLDVDQKIVQSIPNVHNVMVTPHIAGGTANTRKRMFRELAEGICCLT